MSWARNCSAALGFRARGDPEGKLTPEARRLAVINYVFGQT